MSGKVRRLGVVTVAGVLMLSLFGGLGMQSTAAISMKKETVAQTASVVFSSLKEETAKKVEVSTLVKEVETLKEDKATKEEEQKKLAEDIKTREASYKKAYGDKEKASNAKEATLLEEITTLRSQLEKNQMELNRVNYSIDAKDKAKTTAESKIAELGKTVTENKGEILKVNKELYRDNGLYGSIAYQGDAKDKTFIWPVEGFYNITSSYGPRWGTMHRGVDIGTQNYHAKVVAAESGVVVYAGDNKDGFGNKVIIDHGEGIMSLYGHLDSITAEEGQLIIKGEEIGRSGNTGNSFGNHLHFQLTFTGKIYTETVDGEFYLELTKENARVKPDENHKGTTYENNTTETKDTTTEPVTSTPAPSYGGGTAPAPIEPTVPTEPSKPVTPPPTEEPEKPVIPEPGDEEGSEPEHPLPEDVKPTEDGIQEL